MLRTRTVFQSVKRKLHDLSAPDSSRHTSSDSHTPLYMPIREPSPSSRPQLTNLQQDAIWEALTVGLALKHNFEAVYESLLEVAHLPQYSLKPGACSLSTGIQGNVEQRAVNNTIARIKDISDGLRQLCQLSQASSDELFDVLADTSSPAWQLLFEICTLVKPCWSYTQQLPLMIFWICLNEEQSSTDDRFQIALLERVDDRLKNRVLTEHRLRDEDTLFEMNEILIEYMRTFLEQQVIGSGTFNGDSLARAINHFYKIRAKSPYRCSIPADFFTESRRPLSSLRISICPESKLLDFTWPSYAVTSSLRLEFEKDLPKPAPTKFNPPPASIERPHSPKSQLPKDTTTKYPTWWHVEPQPSCPSLLTRSELSLVSSVSSEDVYDPNFFDRRKGDSTQAEMSHVSPPTARPGRTPWPVHEDWQLDVSHESFPWGEEDEEINDVPFGNPINIELVTDAEGLADSEETDIEECKGFMRRGRRKRMRHVLSSTTLEYSSTVSDLVKNQRRLWT